MLLEEFIGVIPALLSALVCHSLQVRDNYQRQQTSSSERQQTFWSQNIHREYQEERSQNDQGEDVYHILFSTPFQNNFQPNVWQSFKKCFLVNIGITPAVIVIGLLSTVLVYFDLNTVDLCTEWLHNKNNTVPANINKWKLTGENITGISLQFWFPATLALLVGWQEFKRNYISTLIISFAAGACVALYKSYLFVFNVFNTSAYYRIPGNAIFCICLISNSVLVARKFRRLNPTTTYSKRRIVLILTFGFFFGMVFAFIYTYFIVPYFNHLKVGTHKAIFASVVPVVLFLPTAITKWIALRKSSGLFYPDRGFLLPYSLRGGVICLYRTMQADFTDIELFVGLSLLHGLSNVLSKATLRLRMKIWTGLIRRLKRTIFGRNLELVPLDTPHMRRFIADIEIQNILFEYTTLILSQAHLVLYQIQSFEISPWSIMRGSLIRIGIGLGIDFFFNNISIFIQIHYHDIPMKRVWFKYWKRHVVANLILLIGMICYFSPTLLTIFEFRPKQGVESKIRNCTLPFTSL